MARAKAVLRRTYRRNTGTVIRVGSLTIDPEAHSAQVDSAKGIVPLELTRTEFRLLSHMASAPNRVFERSELVDACLPEGDALNRTVDSHLSNLRRKLSCRRSRRSADRCARRRLQGGRTAWLNHSIPICWSA